MHTLKSVLAVIGLAIAGNGIAHARGEEAAFITTGAKVSAPRGFVAMCREGGALCDSRALAKPSSAPDYPAQPEQPILAGDNGASDLKWVGRVNRSVNARVIQLTDIQMFGRGELWRRSGIEKGARGDCEDLAIEKRLQLIEQGFPADRLFFAVVYQTQVGLHTILVARLADGDYVLDSRTPYVERWSSVPYSWVSIQDPRNIMNWHMLDRGRPELVDNNRTSKSGAPT